MNPDKIDPPKEEITSCLNILDIACYLNSSGDRGDLWKFLSRQMRNSKEPLSGLSKEEQIANCLKQLTNPEIFKDKIVAVLSSDHQILNLTQHSLTCHYQLKEENIKKVDLATSSSGLFKANALLEENIVDFVLLLEYDTTESATYLFVLKDGQDCKIPSLCTIDIKQLNHLPEKSLFDNQLPGYIIVDNSSALKTIYKAFDEHETAVTILEYNKNKKLLPDLFALVLSLATKSMFPCSKAIPDTPVAKEDYSSFYFVESFRPWVNPQKPNMPVPRIGALIKNDGDHFISVKIVEQSNQMIVFDQMFENELVLLSASSKDELIENLYLLSELISRNHDIKLSELAYTINCQFNAIQTEYRLGIVASTLTDLDSKAKKAVEIVETESQFEIPGIHYKKEGNSANEKTAYLLPGLGSAYENMLWDLYLVHPVTREIFDLFDQTANEFSNTTLPSRFIYPGKSNSNNKRGQLIDHEFAVVAVLIASYALDSILKEAHLKPDAYLGMSTGEFGTYILNGYTNIEEAGKFFYEMSVDVARQIPDEKIKDLVSINIFAPVKDVEKQIKALRLDVYLIADLGPEHIIATGDKKSIELLKSNLWKSGIVSHKMPTPIPYHTPLVADSISDDEANKFSKAIAISEVSVPSWVCSIKSLAPTNERAVTDLCKNLFKRPIYFRETIESMYTDGISQFIEVGPNGILTTKVKEILKDREHSAFASNLSNTTSVSQLNHLIAELYVSGKNPNLSLFYENRNLKPIEELISPEIELQSTIDEKNVDHVPTPVENLLVSSYFSTLNNLHATTVNASTELLRDYFQAYKSKSHTTSLPVGDETAILTCIDEYDVNQIIESSYQTYFLDSELRQLENNFSNEERRKQWIMGRIAAKLSISHLLESKFNQKIDMKAIEILYKENGAPQVILNSKSVQNQQAVVVSISHTDGLACALSMLNTDSKTVGVDIEKIRNIDKNLNDLVLSQSESDLVLKEENPGKSFLKVWTAKEALFKAIGGKSIIQFKLKKIDSARNTVELINEDVQYNITTTELGNYIISYCSNHSKSMLATSV